MFLFFRQLRRKKLEKLYCLQALLLRGRTSLASNSTIVLIPPDEPNNLGDETMVAALVSKFLEMGYSNILCLNYSSEHSWRDRVKGITEDIAYGGLFTRNRLMELRVLLRKCNSCSAAILIGADVLDGGYGNWHSETKLSLLRFLQLAGISSVVAGFSFKNNATTEACQMFKSLPKGCQFFLRDPYSRKRFANRTGFVTSPSADLAFGFKPVETSRITPVFLNYKNWCTERKKQGNSIVAFCPNILLRNYLGNPSSNDYLRHNQQILNLFLEAVPDASLVLVAHDSRIYNQIDNFSDPKLIDLLTSGLSTRWRERLFCFNLPESSTEVDQVCQSLDFAISGRMHFSIACLRSGIPPVTIDYQDKVGGLMNELFLTPELALSMETFSHPADFANALAELYRKRIELSMRIIKQLPSVISLSESYTKAIIPTI